jgi:homoserine/homoserine lactone efflux protein
LELKTWLFFVVTEIALCLTPGPAVMFVVSQGLGGGLRAAVWANLGINAGNMIYFLLSAAGLGALLLASHTLFQAIKWAGAAYLVWLGASILLSRAPGLVVKSAGPLPYDGPRVMLNGMALQLANPKALLFFTALLPQFIDPARDFPTQFALLALTGLVVEFSVQLGYGAAAGRMGALATRPGIAKWVNRGAGALLVAAGVGIAAARRG